MPVLEMRGWVARWTGRAFDGAIFEWLSDAHPENDVISLHEQGPGVAEHIESVWWRGHSVYVPSLSVQLAVAKRRGLEDRAALIREAIEAEH